MLELDYFLFLILPSMEFELCLLIHYNANRLSVMSGALDHSITSALYII